MAGSGQRSNADDARDGDGRRQSGDLCRGCRHYFVTWDVKAPHGCRALGFKSTRRPCRVVYEASGLPCQMRCARQAD